MHVTGDDAAEGEEVDEEVFADAEPDGYGEGGGGKRKP